MVLLGGGNVACCSKLVKTAVFAGDENKTRLALTLHAILLISLGGVPANR